MKWLKILIIAALACSMVIMANAAKREGYNPVAGLSVRGNPRAAAVPLFTNPVAPATESAPSAPSARGQVSSTDEADSVVYQVGTTWYDYFSNGNQNRLIQRDSAGGLHVCWMHADSAGASRTVYYAYRSPTRVWHAGSAALAQQQGAGYCNMEILANGVGVISGHRAGTTAGYTSVVGVDDGYQVGAYNEHPVSPCTNPAADSIIWPVSVVDLSNHVHTFGMEKNASMSYNRLFYTMSGANGGSFPAFSYHNMTTLSSGMSSASTRSGTNRVAVAWANSAITTGLADQRGWFGFLAGQMDNDVCYNVSNDGGTTWSWDNPVNVTRFRTWNDSCFSGIGQYSQYQGDTVMAAGDTFRFYNDAAMIFDNNNVLHIVFVTRGLWEDGLVDTTGHATPPISGLTGCASMMWHWCETRPNEFDLVANGWWNMTGDATTNQLAWQSTLSRVSLSVAPDNTIYAVWTEYDSGDMGGNGWPCGDLYVTKSANDGTTWYAPTNMTNTPGDSLPDYQLHSESWASCQETVNNTTSDSLYIFYLDDQSTGTIVNGSTTTSWTNNPVKVLAFPVDSVHTDSVMATQSLWVAHMPHLLGVKDPSVLATNPKDFRLVGNYPNPFNPTTDIVFSLDKVRDVQLAIYDVNGREVANVAKGRFNAGRHTVTFDGHNFASGVYFARLTSNGFTETRKITLLK